MNESSNPACKSTPAVSRFALAAVAMALLIALTAGVAAAKTFGGTNGSDTIRGTTGNDIINGLGGNDRLYGGYGDDRLNGAAGNDTLYGYPGNDILSGGEHNDTLLPAMGRDKSYGGPGDDTIRAYQDAEPDSVFCGAGYDIADVQANDHVDGQRASTLAASSVTSCERIIVERTVVVDTPRL